MNRVSRRLIGATFAVAAATATIGGAPAQAQDLSSQLSSSFLSGLGTQPAPSQPGTGTQADYSADLTAQVNAHRAANNLPPVQRSAALDASAQEWADYLARTGKFEHGEMTCQNGYCLSENIAITTGNPSQAFGLWRTSPGHNANMLGANAVQVGHGSAIMQSGKFAGQPVVVQQFHNS